MSLNKKSKNESFYDDGRVIADMSIDGIPGPMFRRKAYAGMKRTKSDSETKLTRREHFNVFMGVLSSYLLIGLIVFGSLALFILLWLK